MSCPVLFLRLIQQHISFYLHVEIVSGSPACDILSLNP